MSNMGLVRALTIWLAPKSQAVLDPVIHREERRRAVRHEYEVQLTADTANGDIYAGFSREFSEVGMGALLWADLRIGTEVLLNCRPPDYDGKVTVRARVCQRVGFRYGLEYQTGADCDNASAVQNLLYFASNSGYGLAVNKA